MLCNIWVKDKSDGFVHQIGTDQHDCLELIDGKVEYVNIQSMTGTLSGEYEFIKVPNLDGYVSITPAELKINRKLIHKDLMKTIGKRRFKVESKL